MLKLSLPEFYAIDGIMCFNLSSGGFISRINNKLTTISKVKSVLEKRYDYILTTEVLNEKSQFNTKKLRESYSSKIVSFPSIRYHAENPYCFKHPAIPSLQNFYHDIRLITGCNELIYRNEDLQITHDISIDKLKDREKQSDIFVSQIIQENISEKMFLSFHHPTLFIMDKIIEKFLDNIKEKKVNTNYTDKMNGFIINPPNIHDQEDITYTTDKFKEIEIMNQKDFIRRSKEYYNSLDNHEIEELIRYGQNKLYIH